MFGLLLNTVWAHFLSKILIDFFVHFHHLQSLQLQTIIIIRQLTKTTGKFREIWVRSVWMNIHTVQEEEEVNVQEVQSSPSLLWQTCEWRRVWKLPLLFSLGFFLLSLPPFLFTWSGKPFLNILFFELSRCSFCRFCCQVSFGGE